MHNQIAIDNIAHYTLNNHALTPLRGKIPVLKNWTDRETINNERLEKYIKDGMNLGWVLGDCDLVVDVDPRNGGDESFIQLEKDLGTKINKTIKTIGGFHCYLEYSGGLKLHKTVAKYPGIDFLTQGNQCVIAGSTIIIKGKILSYDWHDDNVFACFEQHDTPKKLIDILLDSSVNSKTKEGATTICDLGDFDNLVGTDDGNWTDASVLVHLRKLDPSMKNDEWVKVGMALHSYHPVGGLKLWEYWSIEGDNYEEGECEKRWASFAASSSGVSMGTLVHMADEATEEVKEEENNTDSKEEKEAKKEARKKAREEARKAATEKREAVKAARKEAASLWDDWVFIDFTGEYMQLSKLVPMSERGFNMACRGLVPANVNGVKKAASTYILSGDEVDYVNHSEYRPDLSPGVHTVVDTLFVNTFNQKTVPKTAEEFTDEGLEAIRVIKEHFKLICTTDENAEILMKWVAFQVQFPGQKIRWSPLIQGIEGCGKSVVGVMIERVLGEVNVGLVSPNEVGSKFNAFATGACVNVLEEISIKGENRYHVANSIKPLITNDHAGVVGKGENGVKMRNITNYILFTNDPTCIPMNDTDRRYWIIFAPINSISQLEKMVEMSYIEYFSMLFNALNKEENWGQFRKFLMEMPLDDAFKNQRAPETTHKFEMIEQEGVSREGFIECQALIERGHKLFCLDAVSSPDLFQALYEQHRIDIRFHMRKPLMKSLGYIRAVKAKVYGQARLIWLHSAVDGDIKGRDIEKILEENYNNVAKFSIDDEF